MSEPEIIITVRGLKNQFGDQVIHDGLDIEVRRGEIFGVSADRARASRS